MTNPIVTDNTVTNPDGSTTETITFSDGSQLIRQTPAAGSPAANQQALQVKATAALAANTADITQNGNIASQAAAVTATTGNLTTAQLSNYVRQLAQAVTILAGNDTNAKKQLTTIIRLITNALDSTDGT